MLKKTIIILTFFVFAVFSAISQSIDTENGKKYFENCKNEELKQTILNSQKQYKIIYLFDIGCSAVWGSFDQFMSMLQGKSNVDVFPITGQDVSDDVNAIPFLDSIKNKQTIYRVERPKRKKFPIQFINMFRYTNKFLKYLDLNIQYKHIGMGGYIILDKINNIVFHTDYEDPEEIYFQKLREL